MNSLAIPSCVAARDGEPPASNETLTTASNANELWGLTDADGDGVSLFESLRNAFAGRYVLESEIGEGGSARVFAAQDLKHNRRVAIKILKAEIAVGLAADRFLREIRIDAALQHPRILPLFDSGEVLGSPYFVMPYVTGGTLRARIQQNGPLPVADALRITAQIADALQYLHSQGLVHRDVKPENVLLQGEHVWLADFGIVRALQDSTTGSVTVTGTAIGTPAYMSPEQRFGSQSLDGKSDQFSLACVLYEMLAGHPPRFFERQDATTPPDGLRATPVRAMRSDVPKRLDDVLARALQIHDADRWPSVRVFAERLLHPAVLTPEGNVGTIPRRWTRRYIAVAAVAAIAGVSLLVASWYDARTSAPSLDAFTVAVLPLAHEGDERGEALDGDDCSRFLRDAIGRWTGIRLVNDMQLREVRARMGRPETVDEAMKMARTLGAGLAVWGVVGPSSPALGSTRSIQLFLYDVARADVKEEAHGLIDVRGDLDATFQMLADSLLSGTEGPRPAIRVRGSRDFGAVRAYLDGHQALDRFDVSAASVGFQRAVEADQTFGLAFLWLAWSTLWTAESSPRDWGAAASRALVVGSGLTARDSAHARALVSMNERRFVDACDQFRALINSDANDFAAWYGLGECLSSDFAVVPSTTSPSRWQFRTSMHEAIGAYEKAIELVPSFTNAMGQRAMQRISRLLFAQTGRFRPGIRADSLRFAAWPSLAADTLVLVPFPERDVFAGAPGTRAASYHQALQRNRDRVLAIVNRWVSLDSANAIALETLALAREANDELVALRQSEAGARMTGLAALSRARMGSTGESAVRLASTEVRFLIKTDRYADAKRLADSLIGMVPADSGNAATAAWMHSVAMLTGRAGHAVQWGRRSSSFQYRDPLRPGASAAPSLSAAASDLATFAALGAPADSIRAAVVRTERALAGQVEPSPEVAYQQYVERPLLYAWPSLGPAVTPPVRQSAGNRWLQSQLALARGDTAAARRIMWEADSSALRGGLAEVAFEIALVNSRLWMALGDTASALRVVGTSVDLVRTSGDQLMRSPTATAAFVRLLVQRASLAGMRGDTAQARAWGTRASLLWRDADPMLVDAMRPVLRWRDVPIPRSVR